jgi:DNA-binding MurR/RpiR family transcriptional regulator
MAVKNVSGASTKRARETNGTGAEVLVGELVRQRTAALSPAERKLARVLLASYPIAGLESVARLAERAGVSPPTVTRFIAKLGFAGYPEFQDALRREIQERLSSPLARYESEGRAGSASLPRASLEAAERNLAATARLLSEQDFEEIVELLADPRRRVMVLGGRLSATLARHLAAQLHLLRSGVELITAGRSTPMEELVDLRRRDLLVLFDYRRYQPDTIEAARAAAARRAEVVLFTDAWLSPASSSAGHILVTPAENVGPFDSLVGPLAVVESVVAAVLARLGEQAERRMRRIEELRALDPRS